MMSTKMTRWIKQAEAAGLVVEIEQSNSDYIEDVSVTITRPKVEVETALDEVRQAERLDLFAIRSKGGGKWKHHATMYRMTRRDKVQARVVEFTIEGMTR